MPKLPNNSHNGDKRRADSFNYISNFNKVKNLRQLRQFRWVPPSWLSQYKGMTHDMYNMRLHSRTKGTKHRNPIQHPKWANPWRRPYNNWERPVKPSYTYKRNPTYRGMTSKERGEAAEADAKFIASSASRLQEMREKRQATLNFKHRKNNNMNLN